MTNANETVANSPRGEVGSPSRGESGSQGEMTKGHLSPLEGGFAAENPSRRASVRANIYVTRVTLRFLRPSLSSVP